MPIGVLSRIPQSVSRGGTCKTNLRGVNPSAPYDYAVPSQTFTVGAALGSTSTQGAGDWSNTITKAYQNTDSEGDSSIQYSGLLSSATSGTLLFRMYIQTYPTASVPGLQTLFINGRPGQDGYAVYLTYDEVALETYEYNLHFGRPQDISANWIKLNTSPLSETTWYQFSIRFQTTTTGGEKPITSSIVKAYKDGSLSVEVTMNNPIITPTNTTYLMPSFFGRMTDFAMLEAQLTDSQLAAFGTAPYI